MRVIAVSSLRAASDGRGWPGLFTTTLRVPHSSAFFAEGWETVKQTPNDHVVTQARRNPHERLTPFHATIRTPSMKSTPAYGKLCPCQNARFAS
jgi:hypothetical protein